MCKPQSTKSRRFMSRPRFGRAGGRRGDARWELTAAAAGLREVTIKLHQQYESPAAVVDFVRRTWQPTFDAMATPFSAIAGAYATLEDDVLSADAVPAGSVVFVNPAYAPSARSQATCGNARTSCACGAQDPHQRSPPGDTRTLAPPPRIWIVSDSGAVACVGLCVFGRAGRIRAMPLRLNAGTTRTARTPRVTCPSFFLDTCREKCNR